MRPFLKSTRFILSVSILAHAAGVIALLYSIGILGFAKKEEAAAQPVPQAQEVVQQQALPEPPPPAEVERSPIVHKAKTLKPTKKAPKLEGSDDAAADTQAEQEVANEDKANDVKIVTPAPIERVENKALLKEDEPAKLIPVTERPDGVQAQEFGDHETEAQSKDEKETSDPAADATVEGGGGKAAI